MRTAVCFAAMMLAGCGGGRGHWTPNVPPVPALAPDNTAPDASSVAPRPDPRTQPPTNAILHPPPPPRHEPLADIEAIVSELAAGLRDAYFDYDRFDLRADAVEALLGNAALLQRTAAAVPELRVMVEGHADERGSAEYNLALGDQRAHKAAAFLREAGVPEGLLEVVSYGREKPQCTEATEPCWQRNRRAHLRIRR